MARSSTSSSSSFRRCETVISPCVRLPAFPKSPPWTATRSSFFFEICLKSEDTSRVEQQTVTQRRLDDHQQLTSPSSGTLRDCKHALVKCNVLCNRLGLETQLSVPASPSYRSPRYPMSAADTPSPASSARSDGTEPWPGPIKTICINTEYVNIVSLRGQFLCMPTARSQQELNFNFNVNA